MDQLNLCIVDDHPIFRKALRELISQKEEYRVAFDANDGEELMQKLSVHNVDIVLLDLYMPKMNGLETIQAIRSKYQQIKIIVISLSSDFEMISRTIELGVHAFISKTADVTELWEAVQHVRHNKLFENKILKQTLYWKASKRLISDSTHNELRHSPIHQRLFELLWQEKNTNEIAQELLMSVSSIEKLKQQLKEKTGARSTIGLIKYALDKRIIIPQTMPDTSLPRQ
jgi:DNA-binding NarL/FixJ family response regulator